MALGGTVKHDLAALEARLREHPRQLLAADLRTRNRTLAAVRTQAVRRLQPELGGLKAGTIRRQLRLMRATAASPRAVLEFSAKRFRLFGNFNVRQTKRGVPLRRLPWRLETLEGDLVPPAALRQAFIQRARQSGVPNVWIRVPGAGRYPITAILAASLATAFRARGLGAELIAFGRARSRVVWEQDMKYRLSRRF